MVVDRTCSLLKSDPAERFERYTDRNGPVPVERPELGRCWIWTASHFQSGYGAFHPRHGVTTTAHRYAYESLRGAIPAGLVVDHLCRNLRRGKGYRLRNGMDASCINGHAYTAENTYRNPNNPRDVRCRECSRARGRKRAS